MLLAATLWVDPGMPATTRRFRAPWRPPPRATHVKVVPGIYNESVTIPSSLANLTILGGQAQFAGQKGPSIVESDNYAFGVEANDVTVKGFTTEPATSAGLF